MTTIGYSFWGFIGNGIINTPDGGRSHRRTLVDGLLAYGFQVLFLQKNRDWLEAREDFQNKYTWNKGFPNIDLLFLEWRWPISGRNVNVENKSKNYTPDLHRQKEIVNYYAIQRKLPTIIWDKDIKMETDNPLRDLSNVKVMEAALFPRGEADSLLFPVSDEALKQANNKIETILNNEIDRSLVYIGNQYGRDEEFDEYFAKPVLANNLSHEVFGKWKNRSRWPSINFRERIGFCKVHALYRCSTATVLLVPRRYAAVGQMTQRIFEAVLAGCIPVGLTYIRGIKNFVPEELIARQWLDVVQIVEKLDKLRQNSNHEKILRKCLKKLEIFRLSSQLKQIVSFVNRTI